MNFHLNFRADAFADKLSYGQRSLFIGSCFAENIGERMLDHKFDCMINPHGVLYNPLSIYTALERYISNKHLQEDELFLANEVWNSWEHHSRFSDPDKKRALEEMNHHIIKANQQLKKANWLFITFGSAFVYKHIEQNKFIGNCHKVPQKQFDKKLITASEIVEMYVPLFDQLRSFNPELKIVFTVSPVRYVRDGLVESNLSKAQLISAVHELVKKNKNVFYFPAYEIVIDELRDHRFYKEDLVHPNEIAINYVYEKLCEVLMDDTTRKYQERIEELLKATQHRPFNEQGDAHQKFKAAYLLRCKEIQKELPMIDLKKEEAYFS